MTTTTKPEHEFITFRRADLGALAYGIARDTKASNRTEAVAIIEAAIIAVGVGVPWEDVAMREGAERAMKGIVIAANDLLLALDDAGVPYCHPQRRALHEMLHATAPLPDPAGTEERIVSEIRAEVARAIAKFPTWHELKMRLNATKENGMSTRYEFWQMAPMADASHILPPDRNPQFTDEMRTKSAQEVAKRFGDGRYMLVRRTDGGSIESVSEFDVKTTHEVKVVER